MKAVDGLLTKRKAVIFFLGPTASALSLALKKSLKQEHLCAKLLL